MDTSNYMKSTTEILLIKQKISFIKSLINAWCFHTFIYFVAAAEERMN